MLLSDMGFAKEGDSRKTQRELWIRRSRSGFLEAWIVLDLKTGRAIDSYGVPKDRKGNVVLFCARR
jgi:hypothetical protein